MDGPEVPAHADRHVWIDKERNQPAAGSLLNRQGLASVGVICAGFATAIMIFLRNPAIKQPGEVNRGGADISVRASSAQTTIIYALCVIVYCAVGLVNIMQGQRYWANCGLIAIAVAVFIGRIAGIDRMLDALIVGGYASLITAKIFTSLFP
ncbi:uncharacterized protein G6M90_00g082180 [Metarhizium brunneum]|uniref:Uncharacterized protein n=1 Tax=Metarhizium brunneum TaxID=500148 RepID=A0A7D5ZAG9_9HYPO|nr:hypothetical protein G6M90_00g082180 [Metarhizium brunneum]